MSKEEKRIKVLKAASDCFAKYGYEKTTLEDIGKVVGLNKASLYYYYKNKENIFCDVIFHEADIYMDELHNKVKVAKSAEEKILSYLGERMNFYKMVVNLHNLSLDTVRKVEPVFYHVYEKVLEKEAKYIATVIDEGVVSKEFSATDSYRVARVLLTVATAIRYKEIHMSLVNMAAEADYNKVLEDIKFVAQLILNGIKCEC